MFKISIPLGAIPVLYGIYLLVDKGLVWWFAFFVAIGVAIVSLLHWVWQALVVGIVACVLLFFVAQSCEPNMQKPEEAQQSQSPIPVELTYNYQ